MAPHGSRSPSPAATPSSRRMRSCARRCERVCCTLGTYFPLAFIYGLTTWAVWVDARIGFHKENADEKIPYSKQIPSAIGVVLYLLLNASYTVAVFTDPGSPTNSNPSQQRGKYSILPTSEPHESTDVQTITVSSSGGARYCKKCHVSKPDRTHHCSTCKRCVLKMDHHCPWLATCLGLHNYKAFVLFLIYVSLFCWACFLNTAFWVYDNLFKSNQYLDSFAPVNTILLAVLSGVIGLVITGFTSWHIYLCVRGQTTIECLEKTRYLSGVRRQVEANRQEHANHSHGHTRNSTSDSLAHNLKRIGDQVLEFHANAVPGASRFEEGEEHTSPTPSEHIPHNLGSTTSPPPRTTSSTAVDNSSPAQRALRSTYREYEQQRESERYEEYVSDQEFGKLPNAFNLGWRRNLLHLFGPNPLLWLLPVCNTTGDGWRWEVSDEWVKANEEAARRKENRLMNAAAQNGAPDYNSSNNTERIRGGAGQYYDNTNSDGNGGNYYDYQPQPTNHSGKSYGANSIVSMHTLQPARSGAGGGSKMRRDYDRSGDGEVAAFEVSASSDEDSDSDSDDDIGQIGSRSRSQREEDGEGWGGPW